MEDEVIQVREVMETLTATLLLVGKLHCFVALSRLFSWWGHTEPESRKVSADISC